MISRLEQLLSPLGNKLGNQRHLQAISNGMMMSLALIVVGSIFLIIANPPINLDIVDMNTGNIFLKAMIAWKQWAVANYNTITIPYTMTMGLIGLVTAFGVAYSLAETYQMKPAINGIISMCVFLMISAPVTDGQLSMTYLGADGLFVALIIGLISVEICRVVGNKIVFTFPESVPTAVTNFVNSLLPLAANIIIIYGLNLVLMGVSGQSLPQFVMSILTPAISGVDNVWAYMGIFAFSNILWLFGINGSSIIFPIVFTLGITNSGLNADLINAGQSAEHIMNLQMYRYAVLGGGGNTLGLVLLMCFSHVKHLKTIGRLSLVPGICGINEPVIFGAPIVLNPVLAIPFVLMPCISIGLGYLVQSIGFVSMGYIVDPSFTPFFAQGFLSALDIRNVIFMCVLIVISMLVYYPFFKVYEKSIAQKEGVEEK
ncbi:MAG: PTS transporter subunit EIIC [Massilimicrobiota sp.]|uniref:PTS sugar transporter subunit IIC n=1 Tax=Massilimicrobiota sp. SW1139 TaxID=2530043 RepID=UPI0014399EA8|nr:PTS transporter subunit EIIC [Massilimicrobiota sp. SW1139]MEE0777625.1 PTS transporter subunit EIIC [Massilimicrobiota sp.]NJE44153.1 PTS sugar transporter subunit IIC [Massilimicrobiota sp. SW1139]